MQNGIIKIKATKDYDDDCTFEAVVNTADIKATASFWGYTDTLEEFGTALANFPATAQQRVRFQSGEDVEASYPYFLLEAYCVSPLGHTALQVIIDNKEPHPRKKRVEFSILAEAAALNKFGKRLLSLQAGLASEQEYSIEWEARTS
ncbi:hypothetical protein [Hymenobacter cheonanensis]|uniref:hypothetical protein n=1 Tax=Hymenobacter sp. CA2-7 TaxID=3063993 RepID=UPI0027139A5C|nr:hypothetical protein [Hymenobacter sp. CA2-7]MDO7885891.1 hypothetical protein [Hymenobacter sp. CA2-7]